jgi:hypothetical protein
MELLGPSGLFPIYFFKKGAEPPWKVALLALADTGMHESYSFIRLKYLG